MRADVITCLVQDAVDVGFERLTQCHTGVSLEPIVASGLDQIHNIRLSLSNGLIDVRRRGLVSHRVTYTDRETIVQKPKVDDTLHAAKEVTAHDRSALAEDDVDKTTSCRTNHLFVDHTKHNLSIFDVHTVVLQIIVSGGLRITQEYIDTFWNAHGQNLLARPVGLGLQNARLRDNTVPIGHPKQHVLHLLKVKQTVTQ